MKIIIALLIALLVFGLMKAIKIGLKRLATLYSAWNFRIDFLSAVEFMLWLVYVFWVLDYLFDEKFYYPYLVIAIIFIVSVLFAWYLVRDIIAGIVFKGKHDLKAGSYIRSKNYSGIIRSKHLTYIQLRSDEGHLLRIPYSRISEEVFSEDIHTESMEEHTLRIKVDSKLEKYDAESMIRLAIFNSPWSNLKEEPSIKLIDDTGKDYVYEVLLFTMNQKHIHFIAMALEENPSFKVIG